ncbi:MAG: aspartate aminotransferase family protein [Candidatus Obscuribacterales bacterium]|nr:aspartate aminotransferase family protein [Candidatus Obscuribacterales bacterium]
MKQSVCNIDRKLLDTRLSEEEQKFKNDHPISFSLFEEAKSCLLGGVPMNWMTRWPGSFPLFIKEGKGAHFIDVDGHEYVDLCLGDSGAMAGHSPDASVEAIRRQAGRGLTYMLPTEDSIWVAKELTRRFGLPYWQMTLTATDANRFAIRLARHITARPYVLVFNWCYHGTVDETFATLVDGEVRPRGGNVGPPVDPAKTTKVVEFNDLDALEKALAAKDVACVLAEPAMTNIGIIHPDPGYHQALRELTRKYGTLLIIDETHTICTGPGGYTAAHALQPDIVTLGKPIAGGVPAAVYGVSAEIAEKIKSKTTIADTDTSGIGGTLAGNALSLAAVKATLQNVLTDESYERTIPLAKKFADGVQHNIDEFGLPWIVNQLGCRAEYWFCSKKPRNGAEAAAAADLSLDRYMHLAALNRGVLLTPFHNMALISPATTSGDIDKHTEVFKESVSKLLP